MANILDTAIEAGSFKTLVRAVQAAGLDDTLSQPGPFTVFAPSDEAFAKLPSGMIAELLNDIPTLTAVLTYHVLPGKVMSGDVAQLTSAKTVNGDELTITANGVVKVNNANVVAVDVTADNGVIHVIDSVILPKTKSG